MSRFIAFCIHLLFVCHAAFRAWMNNVLLLVVEPIPVYIPAVLLKVPNSLSAACCTPKHKATLRLRRQLRAHQRSTADEDGGHISLTDASLAFSHAGTMGKAVCVQPIRMGCQALCLSGMYVPPKRISFAHACAKLCTCGCKTLHTWVQSFACSFP